MERLNRMVEHPGLKHLHLEKTDNSHVIIFIINIKQNIVLKRLKNPNIESDSVHNT